MGFRVALGVWAEGCTKHAVLCGVCGRLCVGNAVWRSLCAFYITVLRCACERSLRGSDVKAPPLLVLCAVRRMGLSGDSALAERRATVRRAVWRALALRRASGRLSMGAESTSSHNRFITLC